MRVTREGHTRRRTVKRCKLPADAPDRVCMRTGCGNTHRRESDYCCQRCQQMADRWRVYQPDWGWLADPVYAAKEPTGGPDASAVLARWDWAADLQVVTHKKEGVVV